MSMTIANGKNIYTQGRSLGISTILVGKLTYITKRRNFFRVKKVILIFLNYFFWGYDILWLSLIIKEARFFKSLP